MPTTKLSSSWTPLSRACFIQPLSRSGCRSRSISRNDWSKQSSSFTRLESSPEAASCLAVRASGKIFFSFRDKPTKLSWRHRRHPLAKTRHKTAHRGFSSTIAFFLNFLKQLISVRTAIFEALTEGIARSGQAEKVFVDEGEVELVLPDVHIGERCYGQDGAAWQSYGDYPLPCAFVSPDLYSSWLSFCFGLRGACVFHRSCGRQRREYCPLQGSGL